jgi:uncharacterized protein YcnI
VPALQHPVASISGAAALLAGMFLMPATAAAHIVVDPASSPTGATQLYTIAVPSEKSQDTVKVEVQFPRNVVVLELLAPAGWHVSPEKDGSGRILGAIWDGDGAGPDQFVAFGVLAENPSGTAELSWSAIQTYADGSEVQWFGPENSQFPATITRVRDAATDLVPVELLAGAALVLSVVTLGLVVFVWRRQRVTANGASHKDTGRETDAAELELDAYRAPGIGR